MKAKAPKWPIIPILVCIFLCVGLSILLSGRAFAAEAPASSGITVDIVPPTGFANGSAAVGFTVTDHAGAGFASAKVRIGQVSQWFDVTSSLEQWGSRYTGQMQITDNCALTVRVTGHDGQLYEKTCYIECFEHGTHIFLTNAMMNSSTNSQEPDKLGTGGGGGTVYPMDVSSSATYDPDEEPDTSPRPTTALTPDGQGTVVDDVSSEDSKEFYTISTPNENIFYLIIDKQRENENVYFLNAVTESDLMALAEKDSDAASTSAVPDPEPVCICKDKCEAGAVNTACPVCVLTMKDCAGTAPAPSETPEPKQPDKSGNTGLIMVVLLVVLAVGGAGYYFKIYKPKHDLSDAEDLDDLTGAEEEAVNEDDQPEYGARSRRAPDEAEYYDHPDNYGDEPEEPEDY